MSTGRMCRGLKRAGWPATRLTRLAHTASSGSTPILPPAGPDMGAELHPLVKELNATLEDFPMPSFLSFIGLSYGVFGASFFVLNASGFDMPALAVAGAVSRLTRWAKKPLDVGLTVVLARAFPASTAIKLGPLLIPPTPRSDDQRAKGSSEPSSGGNGSSGATVDSGLLVRWSNFATRWLEGPVNTYGAPFMLARWITGLSFVSVTTVLVHSGVDITALLGLVFSEPESVMTVSTKASALAGAMVINTVVLPLRVLLFAHYGRSLFVAMKLEPATHALPAAALLDAQLGASDSTRTTVAGEGTPRRDQ